MLCAAAKEAAERASSGKQPGSLGLRGDRGVASAAACGGTSLEDQTGHCLAAPGVEKDKDGERVSSLKEKEPVDETVEDVTEQVCVGRSQRILPVVMETVTVFFCSSSSAHYVPNWIP